MQAHARGVEDCVADCGGDDPEVAYRVLQIALNYRQEFNKDVVLDLVGFADALAGADLVVTGEGSLDEQTLRGLRGEIAIGHTRYSTTGSSQWSNAQPLVQHGSARTIALAPREGIIVTLRCTARSGAASAACQNSAAITRSTVSRASGSTRRSSGRSKTNHAATRSRW